MELADVDMSKDCFEDVRKKDPFRLDNMDTYSNVLYVKVWSRCGLYVPAFM